MVKPHMALPKGVPKGYSWAKLPRIGAGNIVPKGFTAVTGWGQVFWKENAQEVTDLIQVRNFSFFYCHGPDRRWTLLQFGDIDGKEFFPTFNDNLSRSPKVFHKNDDVATIGFEYGQAFHFWSNQARAKIVNEEICGFLAIAQARVVPERSHDIVMDEQYLFGMGADYWSTATSEWDYYSTNKDIAIGRLKFLTSTWKWFGVSTASNEDLKKLYQYGYARK